VHAMHAVRPRPLVPVDAVRLHGRLPVVMCSTPTALGKATRTVGSLGAIVTADVALRRLFLARAIPFPSSLAGMLGLFGGLCTLQALSPTVAKKVSDATAPGCAFISRWLALFFVPNLVLLPLVIQMSASEAVRLGLLVVVGLSASLPLAALTATATLTDSTQIPSPTAGAAPSSSAAPAPAVREFLLDPPIGALAAVGALSGVAAVVGARLGAAWATALPNLTLFICTLVGFVFGGTLPKTTQKVLHPLITCTLITQCAAGVIATAAGLPLRSVLRGYLIPGGAPTASPGNLLLFMLGPATLSFGVQMYGRRQLMRQSARAVSAVTAVSAAFGLFATAIAGRLLRLGAGVRLAALPRQVTAPLAIAIAGMIKADPPLAATIVVVTGLLAANFGRAVLDALNVHSPVARGLAMGAAGHGLGTAAMAEEKEAFPFAAIAMALNAALSTVLVSVPSVRKALLAAAGLPAA